MNSRRKARSRTEKTAPEGMPRDLFAGPCIEVWAPDTLDGHDAWGNWRGALYQWAEDNGVSRHEAAALVARRTPFHTP